MKGRQRALQPGPALAVQLNSGVRPWEFRRVARPMSKDFWFPVMTGSARSSLEVPTVALAHWTLNKTWSVVRWPLAGIVLGIALDLWYPTTWWLASAMHMLGDAIAVGSVIALTVELVLSKILIEATATELAQKLVGAGLPADLQAVIGNIVHRTDLVHDESSIRYRIAVDPNKAGYVSVIVTRRYRVVNYSKAAIQHKPTMGDERTHSPRFLSLECFVGDSLAYRLSEEDLAKTLETPRESRAVNAYGNAVNLEPFDSADATTYRHCVVIWKMAMSMPEDYSDVIAFGHSTVGVFEIVKDDIPDGFEFDATRDENLSFAEGGTVWRYRRAFLPKQHLRVWWRPRRMELQPPRTVVT